jgi:hypothetical protein
MYVQAPSLGEGAGKTASTTAHWPAPEAPPDTYVPTLTSVLVGVWTRGGVVTDDPMKLRRLSSHASFLNSRVVHRVTCFP